MIAASAQFSDFIRSQVKSPIAYAKVQLPTADGKYVASQVVLGNLTSVRLSRNVDAASDGANFTLVDNSGDYSSLNRSSKFGAAFFPGEIDKKVILYFGFFGSNYTGTGNFALNQSSLTAKFTGFVESDGQTVEQLGITKNVSLIDIGKQFRLPVYDTFPHPLYGNQSLSYFDPTYNFKPLNGGGGTATIWQCDGRMFTTSGTNKVYGSSHIDVAVYVDTTGGSSPASTPVAGSTYTFDYANGIITFNTAVVNTAVVSVSGNPTYMAPETMIRKMLVEKANYSANFLNLDVSNVLLPQYLGEDKPLWTCLQEIAQLTNPRFIPWTIWIDEVGVVKFYEQRVDGPPVKTYIDERDLLSMNLDFSAVDLRTVVRADGTCSTSNGDQNITSIAYDVDAINKYGQTEAYTISTILTQNIRHLSPTQATNTLNLIAASALATVSRPRLSLTASIWPDPTLQISDKIRVRSKRTGIDRQFLITTIEETLGPGSYDQQITATEFYDTINFMLGTPAAIASGNTIGASTPIVSTPIIGAVAMGTGSHLVYPFQNGQYAKSPNTGDAIISKWLATDSTMNFNVFLNSVPSSTATTPSSTVGGIQTPYNYNTLPPGYTWTNETDTASGDVYHYVVNDGSGYHIAVGPDSIFYRYNRGGDYHLTAADLTSKWTPPLNTNPIFTGGSQPYTGVASTVYLWQWYYLCLDSSSGVGKFYRPVMRVNPTQDGVGISVPATGGTSLTQTWSGPPGPKNTTGVTVLYGNISVGLTDYATPAPAFVGANVMGDGVNLGVSYGGPAPANASYIGYQKRVTGHYCIYAASSTGAVQFLRIPFQLIN